MKQNIFEIRLRAKELLDEAIKIWQQSPQSENLENMSKDPAMLLLMSALAYQANETDNDIEMLKAEVLDEYVHMLTPYELGHAVPATTVVETALRSDVNEWDINSDTTFRLAGTEYQFMPILRSKVINTYVKSITRLDGRRWKVELEFKSPVKSLSGFVFAINNLFFEDVKVSYKGNVVPMIKLWQYSKMPLTDCFSMDSALYNDSQVFNASMIAMDLFARQNIRLYYVRDVDAKQYMTTEVDSMNLIFEFTGITDRFTFDKKQLSLNCIMLAEAQIGRASLSGTNPIVRVAGYNETDGGTMGNNQFLHLIRPSDEQFYSKARVEVRRISGDRFNQGRLVRLLNALLDKYHSDFYAFQNHKELADDDTMRNLQDILTTLIKVCNKDIQRSMEGVYLLLHSDNLTDDIRNVSLDLNYLTTHGASVNNMLNADSSFEPSSAFDLKATRQIIAPMPGMNEISDKVCEESLMRYHIITNDRIVTPADIKAFCYNELMTRYGIDKTMIKSITVSHRVASKTHVSGYEILAEIVLFDSSLVKRLFVDKIPQTEMLIQKMMEVRSTSIYPIRVSITISEKSEN
jgi:hypothetical protein